MSDLYVIRACAMCTRERTCHQHSISDIDPEDKRWLCDECAAEVDDEGSGW